MNMLGKLSVEVGSGAEVESGLDAKRAQVRGYTSKLDEAETKISAMVNAAVPKVSIRLPKLSPSAFGGAARQDPSVANGYLFRQLPLLNDRDSLPTLFHREPLANKGASVAAVATMSAAELKAAEMAAKATAAERAAQEAASEMQTQASKLAAEAREKAKRRFVAPALAAITSIALSLTLAWSGIGQFAGALIAGQTAVVLNLLALAIVWKGRSSMIFSVTSSVFGKVKAKVIDVLDTVDEMIAGPLQKLEGAIDSMAEEQKPAIEQMQQLESTLLKIDPDFNIPYPEDLKKPLDGCEAMIDEFVEKAKREVPEKLDDLADTTLVGRIATNEVLFNRLAVLLPMSILFAVNALVSLLQVLATAQGAVEPGIIAAPPADRRLRGISATSVAGSRLGVDIWPYVLPAVLQIVLSLLQQLVMLALSQGPRICSAVNSAISSLEVNVNERVNMRVQEAVDRVFGAAFGEVKAQTQVFFPKFKGALGKLEEALNLAGDAQAAMQAASGAANMVKSMW